MVDEPTLLPEGTVLDLVLDDVDDIDDVDDMRDQLDAGERQALDAAITASLEHLDAQRVSPADEVLAQLRARRQR